MIFQAVRTRFPLKQCGNDNNGEFCNYLFL